MEISKTLEDIGKFFNEILGYLLPGLVLFLLTYYFLDPTQVQKDKPFFDLNIWLILFSSYILGYIVYAISYYLNDLFKNTKYFKKDEEIIKSKIQELDEFIISVKKIKELIPIIETQKMDFHSVRNFAMAYVPEVDQKIYTFMFRADLFKHLKDIFLIISFWGIIAYLSKLSLNNTLLFDTQEYNIVIIVLLLILTYPLNEGKKRFLGIAYKIQFNIFLAKSYPIKNENQK